MDLNPDGLRLAREAAHALHPLPVIDPERSTHVLIHSAMGRLHELGFWAEARAVARLLDQAYEAKALTPDF